RPYCSAARPVLPWSTLSGRERTAGRAAAVTRLAHRQPQRTRIKFCGMTRMADCDAAVALGVDAIGLVFAERSARCLSPHQARGLRAALPPLVTAVALFMDATAQHVDHVIAIVQPQLLQFHGSESPADCARHGLPYLRAVPMGALGAADARAYMDRYAGAAGFVLDGHASGAAGGSGTGFDWNQVPAAAGHAHQPLLLARSEEHT